MARELGYVRDRQAILDCLKRYTRGADRHDVELIKSAFWPDASISYGKPISVEEFAQWGSGRYIEYTNEELPW
ncbi:MAG: nuclear transport factor 2 family protein [Gammaproteobacteria bacterium]